MSDGIPAGITRDDVTKAIADFDAGVPHKFAPSTGYDLVFNGKRYPPKAIIGFAARRIARRTLTPDDFKGGEDSRCFRILRDLGFVVVTKGEEECFFPNEVFTPEKFIEGATRVVAVNAYERSAKARESCVDHYGFICSICNFNFAEFYGEIGNGFIVIGR